MRIIAACPGSYPRIGDRPEDQRLRRLLRRIEVGEAREAELGRAFSEAAREILEEQARAGLDIVSDGQVRWHDPVSHIMGRIRGVGLGGLFRYFDTNTYYRQPQVSGPIADEGGLVAEEVKLARAMSSKPVAARLTGPLTLSRMSALRGGSYARTEELFDALVPVIAAEVGRLAAAGAAEIVLEEPALLSSPGDLPRLSEALESIAARRGDLRLWLSVPFGDAAGVFGALRAMPVNGVIVDATASKSLPEAVAAAGGGMDLGLGLVDSRRMKLETPGRVASMAARLARSAGAETVMLVPSNSLEYLPRRRAYEKLVVLARSRDLLLGVARGSSRARRARRRPRRRPVSRKRFAVRRSKSSRRGRAGGRGGRR